MSARFIVESASSRFWARVERGGARECWPWIGSRNEHGYGGIRLGGRSGRLEKAHRVAWMLSSGVYDLMAEDHICHRCDNPPCCNPAHLYRGSYETNVADKVQRGRQASGEGHSRAIAAVVPRGEDHWTHRKPVVVCRNGHDLTDPANVYARNGSRRRCKLCANAGQQRRRARR